MMEPDDFRACLISMGYDLVSTPSPVPGVPSGPSPVYGFHLHIQDLISSSLYPLGLGRIFPFHAGYHRLREVD